MCVFSFNYCGFIHSSLCSNSHPFNCKTVEPKRLQKLVFDRFLNPALLRSIQEPKIEDHFKELLYNVFEQNAGPPDKNENARKSYQTDFNRVMKECGEGIGELYGKEYKRLCAKDPRIKTLLRFPKSSIKLDTKLLTQARFQKKP